LNAFAKVPASIFSFQATLKDNISKYKRGKYGKGLDDFEINDLDWIEGGRKVKAVTIVIYETSV